MKTGNSSRRGFFGAVASGMGAMTLMAAAADKPQRVDMRAHVPAQRETFGSRARAVARHVVAMLFVQPEQERRMIGMVRHPWIIGLRQVVDAGRLHSRQQSLHRS